MHFYPRKKVKLNNKYVLYSMKQLDICGYNPRRLMSSGGILMK